MKLLFDCHCQNFHLCRMEAPYYNQTTLFCNKIVSPSLLFHVNGALVSRQCYSRDEKGRQLVIEL